MFSKLQSQHKQQGVFVQINLLLKGLQINFTYEKPIRDTLSELCSFYHRIAAMEQPKLDDIWAILLLNTLNKHFGPLQQTIYSMSSTPGFTAKMIATCLLDKDALVCHHVELGQPANPYTLSPTSSSAFTTLSS
jgi:hypothetical protein